MPLIKHVDHIAIFTKQTGHPPVIKREMKVHLDNKRKKL